MSQPGDEHLLVLEPDHASSTVDLLLPQHKNLPNWLALVKALAAGAQLAENTAWAVIVGSTLDGAEGATLDRWGEIVGEMRGGLNHEQYRKAIDIRIFVNSEFPSTDNMWTVVTWALEPSIVSSTLLSGGGIIYWVDSGDEFLPASIAAHGGAYVRDFRPMAIYVAVAEYIDDAVYGDEADPGPLFGDEADPGVVFGGIIYDGWR